jgi:hypothetical protein
MYADPLAGKPSVLACRQMPIGVPTAWEQALAKLSTADRKVVVDRLLDAEAAGAKRIACAPHLL